MASWSAENATKAYLQTLRMGERGKEPDTAEFISALAAGNGAKLIVIVCKSLPGPTALALVAAAHQTGGRVVCMITGATDMVVQDSQTALGRYAHLVEFARGDPRTLLLNNYKSPDFVLIDCNIDDVIGAFLAAQEGGGHGGGAIVLGYNALHKGQLLKYLNNTHFLPIGGGLLVSRVAGGSKVGRRKSHWVVKVDDFTGEEHVYRITSPI